MDNEIKKEALKMTAEKAIFEQQEELRMGRFADELKGEYGEKMKNELRNPEAYSVVHKGFFYSIRKWWKGLAENFRIIFYGKEA